MNIEKILFPFFSGILFCTGIAFFFDGIIASNNSFEVTHLIPLFISLMAMFCTNLMTPDKLEKSDSSKVWVFFFITCHMISVGISMWITTNSYSVDDNYPGVSLILSTMNILFSSIIYFIGNSKEQSFY